MKAIALCMILLSTAAGAEEPENPIVLGGIELCGSASDAEAFLAPAPGDAKCSKRWEKAMTKGKAKPDAGGVVTIVWPMGCDPIRVPLGEESGGFYRLHEQGGKVLGVELLAAKLGGGEKLHNRVFGYLVSVKGQPTAEAGEPDDLRQTGGTIIVEWHEEQKITILKSSGGPPSAVNITIYCRELRESGAAGML